MIILPETVSSGNTEPNFSLSDLGIYSGQTYEDGYKRPDVIINVSSWYSAEGAYWGEGGLSVSDFYSISNGLKNHCAAAFFVVPQERGLLCPYEDLTPHEVANWCSFVITRSCVYVFNEYSPYITRGLEYANINFQYARRHEASILVAVHRYH